MLTSKATAAVLSCDAEMKLQGADVAEFEAECERSVSGVLSGCRSAKTRHFRLPMDASGCITNLVTI
jgi:hypothetical protein